MCKKRSFLFVFLMCICLSLSCFVTANAQLAEGEMNYSAPKDDADLEAEPAEEMEPETEPIEETEPMEETEPVEEPEPPYEEDLPNYLIGEGVTMIGDSIMNGNRSIIHEQLPEAYIDAKGSRNVCGGFEAAQKLQWEGKLSDVVIVELGTNGPLLNYEPYASGTLNLLELLGTERQVFWVTVYCSYSQWMAMNNDYIWELSKTRPNFTVIDWYSLSVNHPEWFPDGVHPNVEGARQFAKMLHEALEIKYGK